MTNYFMMKFGMIFACLVLLTGQKKTKLNTVQMHTCPKRPNEEISPLRAL